MKKLILSLAILYSVLLLVPVYGQSTSKEAKKEMKSKAYKKARKESKKYSKDGYYVAPGALPMEKQLEKAWIMQLEVDEEGFPKYIVATGNSVAESQTAAKMQATETAKLELAGTITTNVAALIENNIANQQLSPEDAATVTKTVAASKNIIAQELGRVIPLFEMYENMGDVISANIRIAYDSKTAIEAAKKVIRKKLEEESEALQKKLDELMNF